MHKSVCVALLLLAMAWTAFAVTLTRRASITGGGGDGKCTIEVDVDGVAEVQISGETGRLVTLSGQTAEWRRFQCNQIMPRNPDNFRFNGVDGRGSQQLVRDPRGNGGWAVVRIEDPKGGREGYTFDLEWRGGSDGGGFFPGGGGGGGGGGRGGSFNTASAIRICEDAVRDRIRRDYGYRDIEVRETRADNNRGRNDWIVGIAVAGGRVNREDFRFECSVDFGSGRVRSVNVDRLRR